MATIVTRAAKGSPLTHVEVDANFTNLNTDKVETSVLAAVATSGSYNDLSNTPAPFDPNTLATVATTGAYSDLISKPTLGTAAATDTTAYATAAQGALADSALQGNQTITLSGDLSGSGTTSINAQIAANVVNANELNVVGNGTATQFLRSNADGSFNWAVPTDTNTTYTAGTGLALTGTVFSNTITNNNQLINGAGYATLVSPTFTGTVTATAFSGDGSSLTGVGGGVPSGTVMIFAQTAAPTGWTKSTTHDNKALRVVNGAVGTGGSVAFTTALSSQAVGGSIGSTAAEGTVGATTITTAQMPSHNHKASNYQTVVGWSGNSPGHVFSNNLNYNGAGSANTGSTGSGGSHTHTYSGSSHNHTFSGTAINLAVQYVDVIIAVKD